MTIRTLTIEPFGLVGNSNPEVSVTISLVDGNEQRIQGLVVADGSSVIDSVTLDVHQEARTVDLYPQPDLEPVLNFGSSANQSMSYYLVDIVNRRTRYHHRFRTQVDVGDSALSWAEFANGQGPLEGGELPGWATHIADTGIHVPAGGLTGQGLVKASDIDGDTEWLEGSEVPGITSDIVVSVGSGQDYETLAEAFAFIQSHPLALGYSATGNVPVKAVSFTLNLAQENFSTGEQCRLTGIVARVNIIGLDANTTTIIDPVYFIACSDIRSGGVYIESLTVNTGTVFRPSYTLMSRLQEVAVDTGATIFAYPLVSFSSRGELFIVGNSIAFFGELTAGENTFFEVQAGGLLFIEVFSMNTPLDVNIFTALNASEIQVVQGNIAITSVTSGNVFNVSSCSRISCSDILSVTGVTELANIPPNQIQPDGSAFYDGSTQTTLNNYGETALDFADGGAVSVNISLGQSVELTLTANAVSFNILNPSGHVATSFALLLDTGGFDVLDWTDVTGWFGAAPDLSSGGTHGFGFELIGGAWYGSYKGQVV